MIYDDTKLQNFSFGLLEKRQISAFVALCVCLIYSICFQYFLTTVLYGIKEFFNQ